MSRYTTSGTSSADHEIHLCPHASKGHYTLVSNAVNVFVVDEFGKNAFRITSESTQCSGQHVLQLSHPGESTVHVQVIRCPGGRMREGSKEEREVTILRYSLLVLH